VYSLLSSANDRWNNDDDSEQEYNTSKSVRPLKREENVCRTSDNQESLEDWIKSQSITDCKVSRILWMGSFGSSNNRSNWVKPWNFVLFLIQSNYLF